MPMTMIVASGSLGGTAGIAAGAPTRLMTSATLVGASGNSRARTAGLYGVFWNVLVTAGGSAGGSFPIPVFTYYDDDLAKGVSASAGAWGSLLNGAASTSIYGASASSNYGVSGVVSAKTYGFEVFYCGSGVSGASAYMQVSALGLGGAYTRFDYRVLRLDDFGVDL